MYYLFYNSDSERKNESLEPYLLPIYNITRYIQNYLLYLLPIHSYLFVLQLNEPPEDENCPQNVFTSDSYYLAASAELLMKISLQPGAGLKYQLLVNSSGAKTN